MPFKALFSASGFESAFDFFRLPSGFFAVSLHSFGTQIFLDFGFREQMSGVEIKKRKSPVMAAFSACVAVLTGRK